MRGTVDERLGIMSASMAVRGTDETVGIMSASRPVVGATSGTLGMKNVEIFSTGLGAGGDRMT